MLASHLVWVLGVWTQVPRRATVLLSLEPSRQLQPTISLLSPPALSFAPYHFSVLHYGFTSPWFPVLWKPPMTLNSFVRVPFPDLQIPSLSKHLFALLCVCVHECVFVCVWVGSPHVIRCPQRSEEESDLLELIMSHHVAAETQTWVLWKNRKCWDISPAPQILSEFLSLAPHFHALEIVCI